MNVKIYTLPTCPWCEKIKQWFKKQKIAFEDLDLTEEKHYRDEIINKSGQMGVPVADINGEIVIGYNETELKKALERAKNKKPEEVVVEE